MDATQSPILRLPLELLSRIFLFDDHATFPTKLIPMTKKMSVCNLWHQTCIATPALWRYFNIHASSARLPETIDGLRIWLLRSREAKLDITYCNTERNDVEEDIIKILCPHFRHTARLHVELHIALPPNSLPVLMEHLSSATKLEYLYFYNITWGRDLPNIDVSKARKLRNISLRRVICENGAVPTGAPIHTAVFRDMPLGSSNLTPIASTVRSLTLVRLSRYNGEDLEGDFGSLNLPCLRSVRICEHTLTKFNPLPSILQASSNLTSLKMGISSTTKHHLLTQQLPLSVFEKLKRLRIRFYRIQCIDQIFQVVTSWLRSAQVLQTLELVAYAFVGLDITPLIQGLVIEDQDNPVLCPKLNILLIEELVLSYSTLLEISSQRAILSEQDSSIAIQDALVHKPCLVTLRNKDLSLAEAPFNVLETSIQELPVDNVSVEV